VDGTNKSGVVLTRRVTGTTTLGLVAPDAVISISPAHDCAVVSPEIFICAVILTGLATLSGVTTSQLLPQEDVLADAVNGTLAPVLLVTAMDCTAGALVPICQAKLSWLGLTWMAGVPARVTKIGKLMPLVPGALMATAPLNGPPVAGRAVGFTVTCNPPEMLPDWGFTVSQFPPSAVLGVAEKVVSLELLLESVTDCVDGTVLVTANGKLKEFGFAERGLDPASVSSSARTEREEPVALIFMKPSSVAKLESAGFTETVSCSGVVPLVGVTMSQPLLERADTETLVDPADELMMTVCGVMVPVCALKVNCVGLAVSVAFWARAVSEKHTRAAKRAPRQTREFSRFCTRSSTKNRGE